MDVGFSPSRDFHNAKFKMAAIKLLKLSYIFFIFGYQVNDIIGSLYWTCIIKGENKLYQPKQCYPTNPDLAAEIYRCNPYDFLVLHNYLKYFDLHRWSNINTTLVQRFVFTGMACDSDIEILGGPYTTDT